MLWALEHGERALFEEIVADGRALEGDPEGEGGGHALTKVARFLDGLRADGELDAYFAAGERHVRRDRVIFTGYLTHRELRYLFPCCDAAVFPSLVKEAGPLVFLEALASGAFPLGTYFGGMKASIDSVARSAARRGGGRDEAGPRRRAHGDGHRARTCPWRWRWGSATRKPSSGSPATATTGPAWPARFPEELNAL